MDALVLHQWRGPGGAEAGRRSGGGLEDTGRRGDRSGGWGLGGRRAVDLRSLHLPGSLVVVVVRLVVAVGFIN